MPSNWYRNFHYKDKTVSRPFYLYYGNPYIIILKQNPESKFRAACTIKCSSKYLCTQFMFCCVYLGFSSSIFYPHSLRLPQWHVRLSNDYSSAASHTLFQCCKSHNRIWEINPNWFAKHLSIYLMHDVMVTGQLHVITIFAIRFAKQHLRWIRRTFGNMNYDNFCVSICFWFPQPTVIGRYLGLMLENINLSFVNSC